MSAAVAAILEGMPEPRDLRMHEHDGRCVITAGSVVLFDYAAGDIVMRNIALAALRQLGFRGRVVAAVLGRAEDYVSRPSDAGQRERAAGLRAEGEAGAEGGGGAGSPPPGGGLPAGPLAAEGVFASRYAGAMLLHAFFARADAGRVLAAAAAGSGRDRRTADVALLSAVSICFALGAATTEQFQHLAAADAGPLAGLRTLPRLRTLPPHLPRIPDAADPVMLQAMFASPMLPPHPVTSGVYYVDDHFVPYTGAKPVAKGWNNKRGRAEKGRADTHVTAHDGRAVCFVTGQPSGLSVTLPPALAELKKAAPPGTSIMLGFDRGGAYA